MLLVNMDESSLIEAKLEEFFREVCRTRTQDQGEQGCLIINSFAGIIGSGEKAAADMEKMLLSSIDLFEHLLNRAISKKELPNDYQVKVTAKSLVAFNIGLNNLSKVIRDEQQLWQICEKFLRSHQLFDKG
jgi:TetR/AcrR family transcriptional repressor of nem operon